MVESWIEFAFKTFFVDIYPYYLIPKAMKMSWIKSTSIIEKQLKNTSYLHWVS